MSGWHHVLITGASRGLGQSLARTLAAPGVTLHLCARDLAALEQQAEHLRAQGAVVHCVAVDVADPDSVSDWVLRVWHDRPLDLVILNAGQFDGRGPDGSLETPQVAAGLIATNLVGSIAPALALSGPMRQHGQGCLLFISSLAAFAPMADAPSYSASKSGMTAFARALREDLSPSGVRVVIAHPGHMRTDQTARHQGALPGLVGSDQAAGIILHGLARGCAEIDFPRHLRLALRLQGVLPWRLQALLNRPLRFFLSK
jgi:short-subunit dehydrogenase